MICLQPSAPETASRGSATRPWLRVGRSATQALCAPWKNRPCYDGARRASVLPQNPAEIVVTAVKNRPYIATGVALGVGALVCPECDVLAEIVVTARRVSFFTRLFQRIFGQACFEPFDSSGEPFLIVADGHVKKRYSVAMLVLTPCGQHRAQLV